MPSAPVAPIHSDYGVQLPTTDRASQLTNQTVLVGSFHLRLVKVLGVGAYGVVYLGLDATPTTSPPRQDSPSNSFRLRRLGASLSPLMSGFHSSRSKPALPAPSNSPAQPRKYAVKVLCKLGLDARQRLFQKREIELHSHASGHPNILTIHAVEETEEFIFCVLDYIPDGDLFTMITEQRLYMKPQPFPEFNRDAFITSSFLQILDAVDHCHRLGISHRDLKPENLLCRKGGREIVLADFGLATKDRESSEWGCGSSFYMSPECQAEDGAYPTPHNDLWSCGVILVNLCCGRNPWRQATMKDETFRAFVQNGPGFLRQILPISLGCEYILNKIFCLDFRYRPSIPELREMVKSVRRWNMTEEDLASATIAARDAAKDVFDCVPSAVQPQDVFKECRRKEWMEEDTECSSINAADGWDFEMKGCEFAELLPEAVRGNPFFPLDYYAAYPSETAFAQVETPKAIYAAPIPQQQQHQQSLPTRRGRPTLAPLRIPTPPIPSSLTEYYSASSDEEIDVIRPPISSRSSRRRVENLFSARPDLPAPTFNSAPRLAPQPPRSPQGQGSTSYFFHPFSHRRDPLISPRRQRNPAEFAFQPEQPLHIDPGNAIPSTPPSRKRAAFIDHIERHRHHRSTRALSGSSACSSSSGESCVSSAHSQLSMVPSLSDGETEATSSQPPTPQKAFFNHNKAHNQTEPKVVIINGSDVLNSPTTGNEPEGLPTDLKKSSRRGRGGSITSKFPMPVGMTGVSGKSRRGGPESHHFRFANWIPDVRQTPRPVQAQPVSDGR